ncbi:MAG: PQQ-binding-like beta-propeller repeat protein [Gemmataceae bacterium]|nr:PQQ-binding-like beta-propeller repeat protein [Gemmataceae bacterium]
MHLTIRHGALAISMILLAGGNLHASDHWPRFRGPGGLGIGQDRSLPTQWDKKTNILWQTEAPGRGWSSPIIWGDRVFITAVINDKTPLPRKGLYIQDLIGKIPPGEHVWKLYCYDFATGKLRWERTVHQGTPGGPIHLKNTYASETPATDGQHVYVYFGNLGIHCFDMDGNSKWTKVMPPQKTRMGWGTGSSPILHGDRLYLVNDNEEASYLLALDKRTGKEVWRVERDEKSTWGTPFVWENKARTEIVTAGTRKVRSYDLDGKLLWELKGMSSISIPSPFAQNDLLYVTSGYVLDSMRPLYAIKPGALGDISITGKQNSNESIAWRQPLAGPYHPTPLVYKDQVYVLLDRGFLASYDAQTGKEVYAKQRIDAASDKFTASPWAADGKIFCLSEDGDTYVIRAGPKFEVLAKNSLDEMCLATPALSRGSIVLRTMTKLYRISSR